MLKTDLEEEIKEKVRRKQIMTGNKGATDIMWTL